MTDDLIPQEELLLTRAKVMKVLGISKREFYALVDAKKFSPVWTKQHHMRIPLSEVNALKAEFANRATVVPHEKLIQACAVFAENVWDVSRYVETLGYFRVPVEYTERLRVQLQSDTNLQIIRAESFADLLKQLGKAYEIHRRPDLRQVVECLHMVCKGEKEIAEVLKAKYGREYTPEDIQRYIEYFFNWRVLDPQSANFYLEMLQGRDKLIKMSAYRRADYFVFYALGLDFGGEIPQLIERSVLGLMHKLNFFVDGVVYGEGNVSQRDINTMATTIATLLSAAKEARGGKITPKDQHDLMDKVVPKAFERSDFFKKEQGTSFGTKPAQ